MDNMIPMPPSPDTHRTRYAVLRRNPPLPGEPEWIVYEGGASMGNSVAVFYNEMDAADYAQWRNKDRVRKSTDLTDPQTCAKR